MENLTIRDIEMFLGGTALAYISALFCAAINYIIARVQEKKAATNLFCHMDAYINEQEEKIKLLNKGDEK